MVVNSLYSIKAVMSIKLDNKRNLSSACPHPHPSSLHHSITNGFRGLIIHRFRTADAQAWALVPEVPLLGWDVAESVAEKLDQSHWPRQPNSGKQGQILSRKLGGVCCLQWVPFLPTH